MKLTIVSGQVNFQNINIDNGLSQNSVTSIAQDSSGLLWFSTQDGLNKYSGEFKSYNKYFDDITRKNYKSLGQVYSDNDGKIWIITKGGNLEYLDKISDQFIPFSAYKEVNQIKQSKDGLYWIVHEANKVSLFADDQNKETFKICDCVINDIYPEKGKAQLLTSQGIYELSKEGEISSFSDLNSGTSFSSRAQEQNGAFWYASFDGALYRLADNKNFEKFDHPLLANDLVIYKILIDIKGRLWIGTYGSGLYLLDLKSNEVQHFLPNKLNPYAIAYHDILDIYEDRSGLIWIGTDGNGLSLYDEYLQKFELLTNETIEDDVSIDVVRAIASNDAFLIVGTSGKGLTVFNKNSETWKTYNRSSGLKSDRVVSIGLTDEGKILLGNQDNGVSILDADLTQLKVIKTDLKKMTIWSIEPAEKKNQFWLGTRRNGLILYDLNKGLIEKHIIPSQDTASIRMIKVNRETNNLWLATDDHGLYSFSLESKSFQNHSFDKINASTSLKSLHLLNDQILVGTNGQGLKSFDLKNHEWSSIANTNNGLVNNVVYGIQLSQEGDIWLSTNHGISTLLFDESRDTIINNYTKSDGLQSYEFNTGASFKDNQGVIYFGGIKGVNYFHPSQIKQNSFNSSPIITNVMVSGEEYPNHLNEIEVGHDENSFSINVSSDHLSNPYRRKYAYRLFDYSEDWVETTDPKIQYMNVPSGSYTFELKVANYDGVWGDKILSKKIQIKQAWYLSNVFLGSLIIFALAGLFWFYKSKQRELRYEHQIRENEIKNQYLDELNSSKSIFFTNVTHEFRTPITIIKGLLEKEKISTNSKEVVGRNINKLLTLVDQLIDLSKLESTDLPNKVDQIELVSFLNIVMDSYAFLAREKSIDLNAYCSHNKIYLDTDKEKLKTILGNLISNSIKYTPEYGKILISSEVKDQSIVLSIKDTGIGISKENQKKIFDRFQRANESEGIGSGIGLTIVKSLVEKMGGTISLKSQINQGSTFILYIPAENLSIEDQSMKGSSQILDSSSNPPNPELARLLLIEDNKDLSSYLEGVLDLDYNIQKAKNGKEGIALAIKNIPDLLITDLMMPIMDGKEVIKNLKNNPSTEHIPVIVLTAKVSREDKLECLELGAESFMEKPFNESELKLQIKTLLGNRKKIADQNTFFRPEHTQEIENEFLRKVMENIHQNISKQDFGLLDLCRVVHLERTQVYRKVKALSGMSPTALIKKTRTEHAARMLKEGSRDLKLIAHACGFKDVDQFTKAFQHRFGLSPLQYK